MKKYRQARCLLLLTALMLLLSGCKKMEATAEPILPTGDHMRTYYQIFPYAFADSNGDGVGDIQGIIDKLDYVEALNCDGLWLTPVHLSPTYHKYDVTDYRTIDPVFGTIADYDALVSACHARGMTILLDLVFNHTALNNEWFERCYAARIRNKTEDPYYHYYNFEQVEGTANLKPGRAFYQGDWAYECQFWSGMPDLNLQNVLDEPEGYLANELKDIMAFWLTERDVDGFRLDAVTTYFTADEDRNIAFLTWLNDTAKAIKPGCYIVGEGNWNGKLENQRYQASGIDSFFAFQHSQSAGNLSYAVRLDKAAYLYKIDEDNLECAAGGIPATFIANHDTGRAYAATQAGNDINNLKMAYGLLAMSYGAIFEYYGDEVGMSVLYRPGNEGFIDEDKRQPMPWGDAYTCQPVANSTAGDDDAKYPLGTVKEQQKDADSLLNYVIRANAIRRAFPQIARNASQEIYLSADRSVAVVSKGEGADRIYIVMNASHDLEDIYDTSSLGRVEIAATLSVADVPALNGTTLRVPAQSFVILQQAG